MIIQKAARERTDRVLSPKEGYDMAASWYDTWHWTEFWKRNELPLVGSLLDRLAPGDALDAGSGTGTYRFQLEARGHKTVALDISSKMLDVQAEKGSMIGRSIKATLVNGDIQAMPADWSEAFHCVVCARVLSHIKNFRRSIRELSRVLKEGGHVIITDVDPNHPYTHVKISNGSIHSVIRAFKHDPRQLASAFAPAGLRIKMFRRFALHDLLWLPRRERFAKVYREPGTPIFFICDLVKL